MARPTTGADRGLLNELIHVERVLNFYDLLDYSSFCGSSQYVVTYLFKNNIVLVHPIIIKNATIILYSKINNLKASLQIFIIIMYCLIF